MAITRPTRAFFLGCRNSILYTVRPRELEEGRYSKRYSEAIVDEKPTVPDRHPLHGLGGNGPLPAKKGNRIYRYLRWNFGSVYRRIFSLVFVGNFIAFAVLLARSFLGEQPFTYQDAATAVSANLLACMIVRNEHIVNAMFLVFGTWPKAFPLWCRRLFAKVYSYGGIHSGGGIAATLWYFAFLTLLTRDFIVASHPSVIRICILATSFSIIFLLVAIIAFAHPSMRVKYHDTFEATHRFMGWTSVALFWAQTMLMTADSASTRGIPFAMALVLSPSFWMLIIITVLVIYPWTRLRARDVEAEVLSDHCVKLNFNYRDVQYGQAVRLTDDPLMETHAFAVIPNPAAPAPEPVEERPGSRRDSPATPGFSHAGEKGFSVLVSNAGDWTNKIIHNPPTKIYTRGTPQYGVLRVAGLFEPCIVMATGSGIGPCLSLFVQKPNHPVRIIWSTPNPEKTYGQAVIDLLYKTDPRAIIIDTRKTGRPDLVKIAYRVWESSKWEGPREFALGKTHGADGKPRKPVGPCEAVVIISNMKVTKKVVYGLESRGVPAYGAIFDS
ncbi:hypothetical protein GQ53DRAFT_714199 [Thozetella sp. PMI_491]|nr:hypothetical protein GQ53DRAFT_714199 [Thozetella sp. PMI_491]